MSKYPKNEFTKRTWNGRDNLKNLLGRDDNMFKNHINAIYNGSESNDDYNDKSSTIMRYAGDYRDVYSYSEGEVVKTPGYLSIVKDGVFDTFDYPSPRHIGLEDNLYKGTLVSEDVSAKQIIFGTRYTVLRQQAINGYRINVVAGNKYQVFSVNNPLSNPEIVYHIDFTAPENGWHTFNIDAIIVDEGENFDLLVKVSEPADVPLTWQADWNYRKPNRLHR